jgi:catechol 2,3-dioxygenase-like lactoylglutathione lyase family enzyme
MDKTPGLQGVLETVLYCDSSNESEVRRFYVEVLGLRQDNDFRFVYRAGTQNHVFLVFNTDEVKDQARPPAHGATGPVHTCFLAAPDSYEQWKQHIASLGIPITDEIEWGGGAHSFYFEDPAGNVLEIADSDFWPK